jgi:hypothetical protein
VNPRRLCDRYDTSSCLVLVHCRRSFHVHIVDILHTWPLLLSSLLAIFLHDESKDYHHYLHISLLRMSCILSRSVPYVCRNPMYVMLCSCLRPCDFMWWHHLCSIFSLYGEPVISPGTNGNAIAKYKLQDKFFICFFLELTSSVEDIMSMRLEHNLWIWNLGCS